MPKKVKGKIGDIFSIPMTDDLYCFGQILGRDTIIIFDFIGEMRTDVEILKNKPVCFFAHTVDVKIEDGDWPIVGNINIPDLILPEYIVRTPNGFMIINFNGNIVRKANSYEIEKLQNKSSCSPISIEKAARARFLGEEWKDYYNEILYVKE